MLRVGAVVSLAEPGLAALALIAAHAGARAVGDPASLGAGAGMHCARVLVSGTPWRQRTTAASLQAFESISRTCAGGPRGKV